MKNKQLKWKLGKLPSPSELVELVNAKLLTQEEAKEILFDREDVSALKSEIEFLRKLVDKLSESKTETVKVIEKEIHHYKKEPWYQPYSTWCNGNGYYSTSGTVYLNGNVTNANNTLTTLTTSGTGSSLVSSDLSDLKTF